MTYEEIREGAKKLFEEDQNTVTLEDMAEILLAFVWVSTNGKKKNFEKIEKEIRRKYPEVSKIMDKVIE